MFTSMAGQAANQASQMGDQMADQSSHLASHGTSTMGQMANHASSMAGQMANQGSSMMGGTVSQGTAAMGTMANQGSTMAGQMSLQSGRIANGQGSTMAGSTLQQAAATRTKRSVDEELTAPSEANTADTVKTRQYDQYYIQRRRIAMQQCQANCVRRYRLRGQDYGQIDQGMDMSMGGQVQMQSSMMGQGMQWN